MKILDLFCGGGGAAWGLHLWWPEAQITGVDKYEQGHYPFRFIQTNAIDYDLRGYDFIWCSPPCQPYSKMRSLMKQPHLALIEPMRLRLRENGSPYCIETVARWPLLEPAILCGTMFGLGTYRHRYFETNFKVQALPHPLHTQKQGDLGRRAAPGEMMQIVGHFSGAESARRAMGIEHFMPAKNLSQTIPPAYARYIASQSGI